MPKKDGTGPDGNGPKNPNKGIPSPRRDKTGGGKGKGTGRGAGGKGSGGKGGRGRIN